MNAATKAAGVIRPARTPNQDWVASLLDRTLAAFPGSNEHGASWFLEADPSAARILRRLASDHPDLFFAAAAKHVGSDVELPSHRFLAKLLLRQEKLLEDLTNPASCPSERAVRLFRRLLAVDPTLDTKLKRMLPGRKDSTPDRLLSGEQAARAIDILNQTSPVEPLSSVTGPLPNSPDARIAAKAALSVGARMHPGWIANQLNKENDRLRANAIEAAWGAQSYHAIRILRDCVGDKNSRVAGNALIGLHRAGCPEAGEHAVEMSRSEIPGRRSTAAWAMGKIGSAAFTDSLAVLLRDESPLVRSTAIRSLVQIGQAETNRRDAREADTSENAWDIAREHVEPEPEEPQLVALEALTLEPVAIEPAMEESPLDLGDSGKFDYYRR